MVAVLKPQTPTLEDLVDEFASLNRQVKDFDPILKLHTELKKLLADRASEFGPGEVRLSGRYGFTVFSKPATTRRIPDIWKAFRILGLDSFVKAATLSVTAVDKMTTPAQQAELFEVSEGPRKLKDAGSLLDAIQGANQRG